MQMKSFFTIYKFQFLKNLNSWNIKVNLLFNFFCMLLLIFVSAVKNETRNLQKEINDLQASISQINFNLNQAILSLKMIYRIIIGLN